MSLEAAEKVLKAISGKVDQAAVKVVHRVETMLKIANSEPSVVQSWDRTTYEVLIGKEGRLFSVSLEPKDPQDVAKAAEELIALAGSVEKSPFYAPLPKPSGVSPRNVVDARTLDAVDRLPDLAEMMVRAAEEEGAERCAGMITIAKVEKSLATSTGVSLKEEKSSIEAYLRAFAGEDGSGQWAYGSTRLEERALEDLARRAGSYAKASVGRKPIEPGRYQVLLSPMVLGNLLEIVAHSASAFSILLGMSFFQKNKPGDVVASEALTLLDDPENSELPGVTGFDDEGIPARRKAIIEGGVLKTILHNSSTAKVMGAKPTGNAGWISPTTWNHTVLPGDASEEELIGEIKKGIVITNNWYTRLQNYVEGTFSTIGRDAILYVENGEVKHPLTKIRIADSFPRILRNVKMLGKELHKIRWWEVETPSLLPFALLEDVNISLPTV